MLASTKLPCWYNVRTGGWHVSPLPRRRGRLLGVPMPLFLARQQFDVRFEPPIPTLQLAAGLYVQPDRHFASDGGSIPLWVQALVPGLDTRVHEIAYLLHDACYRNGVVYECSALDGEYRARRVGRDEADELLRWGIVADGGTRAKARTVWLAVRAFGWRAWSPRVPAGLDV